jgi:hypothetical protein
MVMFYDPVGGISVGRPKVHYTRKALRDG